MWWHDIKEIKEWMESLSSRVVRIDSQLDDLIMKEQNSFDKFEDYMKNVDKLNTMINEFKGVISIARAAVAERKEQQKELEEIKETARIAKDIYKSMNNFINASNNIEQQQFFKLDAIYRAVCEREEEKPKKKIVRKRKKTTTSA